MFQKRKWDTVALYWCHICVDLNISSCRCWYCYTAFCSKLFTKKSLRHDQFSDSILHCKKYAISEKHIFIFSKRCCFLHISFNSKLFPVPNFETFVYWRLICKQRHEYLIHLLHANPSASQNSSVVESSHQTQDRWVNPFSRRSLLNPYYRDVPCNHLTSAEVKLMWN